MTNTRLPDGAVIRLNRHARVWNDGAVLVGGSPTRVLRLKPAAVATLLDREVTIADPASRTLAELLVSSGLGDPVASSLPPIALRELSVVIPVKDRHGPLDRLLASLPSDVAATIVVDDGSEDPSCVARVAENHHARLVALPENQGVGAARNAGLAEVTTPYVAFIDSDVVMEPGTLEVLLRHFADPNMALVAPRVLGLEREQPTWITRYENARSSLDLGPDAGSVRPRSPLTWVSGTCLVARVEQVGAGFDPSMDAGEDVDFVWRLVSEGRTVRFEPSVAVLHEHRTTARRWLRRKFLYGTGAQPLAQRHPENIPPVVLPPWGAAVLGLLLVQRRWSIVTAAAIVLGVFGRIRRRIDFVDDRTAIAAQLTSHGLAATLGQGMALLVRHWWPLTLVAAVFSRRIRRAAAIAAVVDAVWEYVRLKPALDPMRFGLARRLDDLSYGAGVWASALRGRSLRALLPAITRSTKRPESGHS